MVFRCCRSCDTGAAVVVDALVVVAVALFGDVVCAAAFWRSAC